MATRYAMVPELGARSYDDEPQGFLGGAGLSSRKHSEETPREIDRAVRGIVDGAFARVWAILERNRDVLEAGARDLLARETLSEGDLAALFARISREPEPARPKPVA